jgi:ATP-dependent 26S proteasome regulatory subunit
VVTEEVPAHLFADLDVAFTEVHERAAGRAQLARAWPARLVDVLEPALAQRPGRVDLAVEVPLPDRPARRRLITLYARDLPFTPAALDRAASRAEGTTASFARELVRRAVLIAADAGRDTADADLDQALDEMLSEAQAITRSLLGSGDAGGS